MAYQIQHFTILGSTTISSTDGFTSRQFTNKGFKGILLTVNRSAETGTATLDAKLQYKDPVRNAWLDIEGATLNGWADGETGDRYLMMYPGLVAADSDNHIDLNTDQASHCGSYLPKFWRLVLTTTGTTNVVSAGAQLLP